MTHVSTFYSVSRDWRRIINFWTPENRGGKEQGIWRSSDRFELFSSLKFRVIPDSESSKLIRCKIFIPPIQPVDESWSCAQLWRPFLKWACFTPTGGKTTIRMAFSCDCQDPAILFAGYREYWRPVLRLPSPGSTQDCPVFSSTFPKETHPQYFTSGLQQATLSLLFIYVFFNLLWA